MAPRQKLPFSPCIRHTPRDRRATPHPGPGRGVCGRRGVCAPAPQSLRSGAARSSDQIFPDDAVPGKNDNMPFAPCAAQTLQGFWDKRANRERSGSRSCHGPV